MFILLKWFREVTLYMYEFTSKGNRVKVNSKDFILRELIRPHDTLHYKDAILLM